MGIDCCRVQPETYARVSATGPTTMHLNSNVFAGVLIFGSVVHRERNRERTQAEPRKNGWSKLSHNAILFAKTKLIYKCQL